MKRIIVLAGLVLAGVLSIVGVQAQQNAAAMRVENIKDTLYLGDAQADHDIRRRAAIGVGMSLETGPGDVLWIATLITSSSATAASEKLQRSRPPIGLAAS